MFAPLWCNVLVDVPMKSDKNALIASYQIYEMARLPYLALEAYNDPRAAITFSSPPRFG
jgi:hypothetical protein